MALPKTLKNFDTFQDGVSFMGQVRSVTLPKLARKMEDFRGAGMDGTLKLDTGADAMELGFTAGGYLREALRKFGATSVGGVMLRWAGAYQAEDTGIYESVEIVARGRYSEIDRGDAKPGDTTEHKFTMQVSYYKETVNGVPLIEIDVPNNVFIVDGIDILAAQRAAIGHW
jgi:P2 family phage contractile tail tube protein